MCFRRLEFPWPLRRGWGHRLLLRNFLILGGGVLGYFHFGVKCESLGSLGVAFFSLKGGGCLGFECCMGVGRVAMLVRMSSSPSLPFPLCA